LAWYSRKAGQEGSSAEEKRDVGNPISLKEIDVHDGWLTDLNIENQTTNKPVPARHDPPKNNTAWHFDKDMAQATLDYHAGGFEKKDQFIQWNDPHWVDAGTRFFFTQLDWTGDGQTFQVHPVYADTVPGQHNGRGPRWLKAGMPVGHAGTPIHVKRAGGPLAVVGTHTLRVQYDNLAPAGQRERATFLAYSDGDNQYRYTERVGMMPRGFNGLSKGNKQTITFPRVKDLTPGHPPVSLNATSDSGLPVEYYVAYGPAKIVDGKLEIAELPVRSKFPIELKVVAYQFGSGVEPLVQTAEPVEQTIHIRQLGP
jgi:hypothetical protein